MKSDIFLTVLRRNTFNNINQKYFHLLVFEGKKFSWKRVIKTDKERREKNKGF